MKKRIGAIAALVILFTTNNVYAMEAQKDEQPIYAIVSGDAAAISDVKSNSLPILVGAKETIVKLSDSAFNQLIPLLKKMDEISNEHDEQAGHMQIDQIELTVKTTAAGNFAIASGSAEGSIKFVLKRKNIAPLAK